MIETKHRPLEETALFQSFEKCSKTVWDEVARWRPFDRDTVGKQVVRSLDSVGANIVEGDGRMSVADGLHFLVIARGSAREASLWLKRAIDRNLISSDVGSDMVNALEDATKQLNGLITYRRNAGKFVKEDDAPYDF